MAAELKPYRAYKDSGVEGLGKVPAHWEVRRLKSWLGINELVLSEDTDPEHTLDYLDIGLVDAGRLTARPEQIRFRNSPSRARRVVRSGDTLVSTVRTYLKAVWHADDPGADLIASTGFAVLTPRRGTLPRFVSYVCQSDPFTNRVTAESVGIAYPAISETKLGTFEVWVPPLPEQAAIVRFLDHADRRIRRYICAKQQLIALLEEQTQALIFEAATGRIDVRTGRPYPDYEDTDVKWLGAVPAHWEVMRVKHVSRVLRGAFTHRPRNDPSLYDGPYPFIQTGEVTGADKRISSYRQTLNDRGLAVSRMFPAGTLVMAIAANIGDVAILDFEACFPDSVVGFVPGEKLERDFLYYVFRAMRPDCCAKRRSIHRGTSILIGSALGGFLFLRTMSKGR